MKLYETPTRFQLLFCKSSSGLAKATIRKHPRNFVHFHRRIPSKFFPTIWAKAKYRLRNFILTMGKSYSMCRLAHQWMMMRHICCVMLVWRTDDRRSVERNPPEKPADTLPEIWWMDMKHHGFWKFEHITSVAFFWYPVRGASYQEVLSE